MKYTIISIKNGEEKDLRSLFGVMSKKKAKEMLSYIDNESSKYFYSLKRL